MQLIKSLNFVRSSSFNNRWRALALYCLSQWVIGLCVEIIDRNYIFKINFTSLKTHNNGCF